MKSAPAIAFDFRPSRIVLAPAAAVVALATAAPWFTRFSAPVCAMLSLAACGFGAWALWRFLHPPFQRVAWRASGWTLVDAAGNEHAALLESHARLGTLLALGFRYGAHVRCRLVLAPDNAAADTRRRLILLLGRAEVVQAP